MVPVGLESQLHHTLVMCLCPSRHQAHLRCVQLSHPPLWNFSFYDSFTNGPESSECLADEGHLLKVFFDCLNWPFKSWQKLEILGLPVDLEITASFDHPALRVFSGACNPQSLYVWFTHCGGYIWPLSSAHMHIHTCIHVQTQTWTHSTTTCRVPFLMPWWFGCVQT